MEIITKKRMMLFSGTIHPDLGAEIADNLGIPVCACELRRFASGEIRFHFGEAPELLLMVAPTAPRMLPVPVQVVTPELLRV